MTPDAERDHEESRIKKLLHQIGSFHIFRGQSLLRRAKEKDYTQSLGTDYVRFLIL